MGMGAILGGSLGAGREGPGGRGERRDLCPVVWTAPVC